MSEISTGIILDGITLTLHRTYPESHVHAETVEQGLVPRDFIVVLITAEQKQLSGTHYQRSPAFDVLYFPEKGKAECYDIADELYALLELIRLHSGELVRGTDMSFEVVDSVLHFRVNYKHVIRRDGTETKMEDLEFLQGG